MHRLFGSETLKSEQRRRIWEMLSNSYVWLRDEDREKYLSLAHAAIAQE